LFAVFLLLFAITSNFNVALPVAFMLGAVYFLLATAMMTELQHNLTDGERASIMPLWFMSFGGSIPIGNLLGGPIMDAVGARWVLAVGAVAAALNGVLSDLGRLDDEDFLDGEPTSIPETGPSRLH